jgi:CBS domain-containing protein
MLFTVQDLIADAPPVITVHPNDAATTARRKMVENDYSQLPVVDGDGRSLGTAVTFRAILNALTSLGTTLDKLTVDDVMAPAHEVRVDADVLTVLDDIQDESFLLIVDAEKVLKGIITTFDTTAHFRRYAEDLMVVEDVETMLRESIRNLYTDEEVESEIQKVVDKKRVTVEGFKRGLSDYFSRANSAIQQVDEKLLGEAFSKIADDSPKHFDKLTFNELAEVLLRHPSCPRPALADGVRGLRRLLQAVRDTRNDVAHFRGEVAAEQRESLRYCSDWLSRHLPSGKASQYLESASQDTTESENEPLTSTEEIAAPTEETIRAGDSTYAGLALFLKAQPAHTDSRTLSFEQVEQVIQYPLPKSARVHRAWWSNDPSHSHAAQWLDVGWRAQGISMTEQRVTFVRIAEREEAYIYFFNGVMDRLRAEHDFPLKEASPQGVSWHVFAEFPWIKPSSANLNASFTRQKMLRIELYLDAGNITQNKKAFDILHSRGEILESKLGPLSWERMESKRASRIAIYTPASISGEPIPLDHVADWAARTVLSFYKAFQPEFETL